MEYAKTSVPTSLVRSVSSVQTSVVQRMLPPPQPRLYKVCMQNHRRRKGFTATSLADLMEQVCSSFLMTYQFLTLVLEDDGTVVDSEAFFQSLPINTPFMVLEKGEDWTPNKLVLPSFRQLRRGIARLSVDQYRLNPEDFLACLIFKATLYEIHDVLQEAIWDYYVTKSIQSVTGAKRSLLWFFMYMAKLAGQVLLCRCMYLPWYIGDKKSSG